MTYIEKALQEEEKAGSGVTKEMIIKGCCPSAYGFSNEVDCKNKACADCWNREIPDTNKSVLLTMNKETELNIDKKIKEQEEKSYNKGLNDAWELMKKLYLEMPHGIVEYIFDTDEPAEIIERFTIQEALEKLKAYEDSKIKVGDVVNFKENVFVVIRKDFDSVLGIDHNGETWETVIEECKKTGKHIDIKSILEQIGE